MTKTYTHLSPAQRYKLEALLTAGHSKSYIADQLQCHRSSVYRELRRNTPQRGRGAKQYVAEKAQQKTDLRHCKKPKFKKLSAAIKEEVADLMGREKLSPELAAARLRGKGKEAVSPECLYQWIWLSKHSHRAEHRPYRQLYRHLKHGRRRRKRGNYKSSRGLIPNRVSIVERPKVVEKRDRLGDMEVDLIIGKGHKGGLLVTLDRCSRITTLDKREGKGAKAIAGLLKKRMKQHGEVKTITFDNDQAFCLHQEVAQALRKQSGKGVKTYFTRPYTSQDKGSIENRNGVVRRFYPKKTNFTEVSEQDIKKTETYINDRPMRMFGYLSPNEVHKKRKKKTTCRT